METFSAASVARVGKKISEVDDALLHPASRSGLQVDKKRQVLQPGDSLWIDLPQGENAVYEISFQLANADSTAYAQLMRNLIFKADFDGRSTVWVPLSDYSGGGMGAPAVDSWFLSADGQGKVVSRWLMPYKTEGRLLLQNISAHTADVSMEVGTAPLPWGGRSLYFHASWRQQTGLPVYERPDDDANCREWNFATLTGRGIYKGDVLTLYNHSRAWYGEGDEKIWVDDDVFPSHFGTGTEDYYGGAWSFATQQNGQTVENQYCTPYLGYPYYSSHDTFLHNDYHNDDQMPQRSFYRWHLLDPILFEKDLKVTLQQIGVSHGGLFERQDDVATTAYWYQTHPHVPFAPLMSRKERWPR